MNSNFENALPAGTCLSGEKCQYEIVKVLGQGSFGITYLASIQINGRPDSVETYVAIKEFFMSEINGRDNTAVTSSNKAGLFDKYKQKFIKEAQSLGHLDNSGIVKLLESFAQNNTVYYSMDLIEGGSLDNYIANKGQLSERETMDTASLILDALSYMHSKKMLHLDLKPSNVMMSNGKPVLIDFGLSKQYDDNGNPESSTTIGSGTPGYAPIEQSNYDGEAGKSRVLPVTMDFYALGATMFKMLCGKKPPLASDILNIGFPSEELQRKGVSARMQGIVKALMQPLWKDRPQTDDAVRELFSNPDTPTSGEETVIITDEGDAAQKKSKTPAIIISVIIALLLCIIAIIAYNRFGRSNSDSDKDYMAEAESTDTADSNLTAEEEPIVPEGPEIKYFVKNREDFENALLCAYVDGDEKTIGIQNNLFDGYCFGYMDVEAQEDFNGDGVIDALVSDINPGSGGGSGRMFVTYNTDTKQFEKSEVFKEYSFYEVEITDLGREKVVDFILTDLGKKIVKERFAFRNGHAVSIAVPKTASPSYTILKSVDMDDWGDHDSFYFDLNDDGVEEKIESTGAYHAGRDFEFYMNGNRYEFFVGANWGAGTLRILKSKTNGMHDIISEQEARTLYKWEGDTYVTHDFD
ncbi:MAG: serine/threonine protein kinase [Prevotella sp.]|nr:serine/threonine protein kinase [Prevotella sp.]MCM1075472.1 serine/threonine protein kinase [Ruminococcus sp.]